MISDLGMDISLSNPPRFRTVCTECQEIPEMIVSISDPAFAVVWESCVFTCRGHLLLWPRHESKCARKLKLQIRWAERYAEVAKKPLRIIPDTNLFPFQMLLYPHYWNYWNL
jgi:hypothetical protein